MDLFETMLTLVVVNLVVGLVCGLAAPRKWAQWPCVVMMVINILPILGAIKCVIGMTTGRVDGLAGLIILPGILITVEQLWLLLICYRNYWCRQTPSTTSHNGTKP